jgi:hypothetical protein
MSVNAEDLELKDRLSLIETMIAEGRRTTESWGWTFVLWGVAYYIAIAWAALGRTYLAWPVTMIAAFLLTAVIAVRKTHGRPRTTMGRAIASIWIAMGISMFVLFMALGWSGKLVDDRIFVAIAAAMMGTAYASSSMILKWKLQFVCAVVWWAAAVLSCFGSVHQSSISFLTAIFFCQIVFGIYGMIAEASQRRKAASHA